MKKMTRAELDVMAGKKAPPPAAAPEPSGASLAEVHTAIAQLAGQVEQATKAIAQSHALQARGKELKAIIHRGSDGKMKEVTITVV